MQEIFNIFILGLIQGVLEFLPVSSSAHLELASSLLNFRELNEIKFFLELGAFLAILLYFLPLIIGELIGVFNNTKSSYLFFAKVFVATIPFALAFPFLYKTFANVSLFLILGSVLMIVAEVISSNFAKEKVNFIEKISFWKAFLIGVFQVLSIFSGFSRSGSTISGGLICGLSRGLSVKFSFLISLPLTFCSLMYDFYSTKFSFSYLQVLGFAISFLTSLLFIKFAFRLLSKIKLYPFIIYRILIALLLISLEY
jgi:undecaprenyl-diphosphatase